MENETKPKTKAKHPDRVTLAPEALWRVSKWLDETRGQIKGSKISRSDLVSFLIMSHSPCLSEGELKELEGEYFDEVRFAAWALGQLKDAKAQGKTVSLNEILGVRVHTPKKEGQ